MRVINTEYGVLGFKIDRPITPVLQFFLPRWSAAIAPKEARELWQQADERGETDG
jgi:hypothetical protein